MPARRPRQAWAGATGALAVAVTVPSCREPTQITVTLRTDVSCAEVSETTLGVGTLTNLAEKPPVSSRKGCKDAGGRIGSLVIVPSDARDDEVALQAVTTVNGQPASACDPKQPQSFCIVARRALRFVPHTPLDLPIDLSASCLGKVCDPDQTCFEGTCVTARLPDPGGCTTPGGCGQQIPTPDASADASQDGPTGADAGTETGADAPATDASAGDLVAWFNFDETPTSAVIKDLSGSGNDGQLQGANVIAGVGHSGGGLVVNSTSGTFAVNLSQSPTNIDQNTGVTVALWILVKKAPDSMGFLFDHDPVGVDDLAAWVGPSLELCIDAVTGHEELCGYKNVTLGTWLHFAMVADASMMRAYHNGVPAKAQTAPPPVFHLNGTLYFGYAIDAVLDDIRVYKGVLGDADVAALVK